MSARSPPEEIFKTSLPRKEGSARHGFETLPRQAVRVNVINILEKDLRCTTLKDDIAGPPRLAPRQEPKSALELRTITDEEAGQRIDNFLMRHFKSVPRSRVYRLLRKGEVRVNSKRVDAEYRMRPATKFACRRCASIPAADPGRPSEQPRRSSSSGLIFQDKHLLVIDKPAGVAVHGGSGMSFGVIEALRASRPRETLELVHRLDRDTSGCLCVARDRATLVALHALIRESGHAQDLPGPGVGQLAAGHEAHRCAACDRCPQPAASATCAWPPAGKASVSVFKPVQFFGRRRR